jgi:hypothetical protein
MAAKLRALLPGVDLGTGFAMASQGDHRFDA